MAATEFSTSTLSPAPDEVAPDGANVRRLHRLPGGSMAHFELPAGAISTAIRHATVDEIWYFLSGRGEMWRRRGKGESRVDVGAGVSVTVPAGTAFQVRAGGDAPVTAVAVTIPPWPGLEEAAQVEGPWQPTVGIGVPRQADRK